jgi:hypothetical protein
MDHVTYSIGQYWDAYLQPDFFWMPNFTQMHKIIKLFLLHIPWLFGENIPQIFPKNWKIFITFQSRFIFATIVLASFFAV